MKSKKSGFTLIELLVVIGIIALLSTMATVGATVARERAKREKARADLSQINVAINLLVNDTSQWPGHQFVEHVCRVDNPPGCNPLLGGPCCDLDNNELCDDGCADTLSSGFGGITQTDGLFNGWNGPYIQTMPVDPWGNEYFIDTDYDLGGGNWQAVIGSYGPDGREKNGYDTGYSGDDIIKIIGFDQ